MLDAKSRQIKPMNDVLRQMVTQTYSTPQVVSLCLPQPVSGMQPLHLISIVLFNRRPDRWRMVKNTHPGSSDCAPDRPVRKNGPNKINQFDRSCAVVVGQMSENKWPPASMWIPRLSIELGLNGSITERYSFMVRNSGKGHGLVLGRFRGNQKLASVG